eukprot:66880-Chlamydomonas_euryale.AAC.1
MRVLPHILAFAGGAASAEERMLSDELDTLASTWVVAYMERHRKRRPRDITEADFDTMRSTLAAFI